MCLKKWLRIRIKLEEVDKLDNYSDSEDHSQFSEIGDSGFNPDTDISEEEGVDIEFCALENEEFSDFDEWESNDEYLSSDAEWKLLIQRLFGNYMENKFPLRFLYRLMLTGREPVNVNR